MSITRNAIWAPIPLTTRAVPVHLSYDLKSNKITYANGKSIFIRSVSETLDSIQFLSHNATTTVAKFSPSGFYIASGDETGIVKIWDCVGDDLILKGEYPVISGRINDISWDSESKRVIAVGNGKERYGHCFTWDSGNTVGEISGHSSQVNAVTIKPTRPYRAATVSDDGGLVFYQGPPFKFTQSVRGHHNNFVRDVSYSADGEFIISVGADRKIVVYDGKTGEFVKEITTDHKGGIFGINWDLNNPKQFVTCSLDSSVKLYNVDTGELVQSWQLPASVETQQLGVVSTKDYFISLSLDGTLNYWQLESDKPVNIVEGHQKSITSLTTLGDTVYSGSYDGKLIEWDSLSGTGTAVKASSNTLTHANLVVSLQLSKDSVLSCAWDDTVKQIKDDEFVNSMSINDQPKMMSSFGDVGVVATTDKLIIFNTETLKRTNEIKTSLEPTLAVSVSSKYIVVGLQSRDIAVYDVSDLSLKLTLPATMSTPTYAAISPDEKYVAVGDSMGKIVLYDLATSQIKTSRWSFHTSKINCIAWHSDNDHVVSASLDTNIIVYSVAKPGRNIKLLNTHKDGVNVVAWLDDTIISGGNDSCIKKWSVEFI